MQKIKWGLILLVFGINTSYAVAPPITCPAGTIQLDAKLQNKTIMLPGVGETRSSEIYYFKNLTQQSLWLDHPVEKRAANAGWSSYLRPGKWSALLLNRQNFVISCAVINPGKVDYQHCSKAILVCVPKPKTAVFESKRKGTYWLAEDQAWEDLVVGLGKRGVKFSKE